MRDISLKNIFLLSVFAAIALSGCQASRPADRVYLQCDISVDNGPKYSYFDIKYYDIELVKNKIKVWDDSVEAYDQEYLGEVTIDSLEFKINKKSPDAEVITIINRIDGAYTTFLVEGDKEPFLWERGVCQEIAKLPVSTL